MYFVTLLYNSQLYRYSGPIANYDMRREEIRDKGYILAVPDEFLKSCKVGNVLFRVWFQVRFYKVLVLVIIIPQHPGQRCWLNWKVDRKCFESSIFAQI